MSPRAQAAQSHARELFPFDSFAFMILGGLGPTLAAVIMMLTLKGKDGPGKLLAPIFQWKVGIICYVVALLGQPTASCAVLGLEIARRDCFKVSRWARRWLEG